MKRIYIITHTPTSKSFYYSSEKLAKDAIKALSRDLGAMGQLVYRSEKWYSFLRDFALTSFYIDIPLPKPSKPKLKPEPDPTLTPDYEI